VRPIASVLPASLLVHLRALGRVPHAFGRTAKELPPLIAVTHIRENLRARRPATWFYRLRDVLMYGTMSVDA
jgi:hypothetical protein